MCVKAVKRLQEAEIPFLIKVGEKTKKYNDLEGSQEINFYGNWF